MKFENCQQHGKDNDTRRGSSATFTGPVIGRRRDSLRISQQLDRHPVRILRSWGITRSRRANRDKARGRNRHDQVTSTVAAAATADGLRRELDRIRRRASSCPAAADGGAPGRDAELLADLLAEVESAGRAMAAEADRRGVAGAACERAYDGVSGGGALAWQ